MSKVHGATAAAHSCLLTAEISVYTVQNVTDEACMTKHMEDSRWAPSKRVTEWRLRPGERAPIMRYDVTSASTTKAVAWPPSPAPVPAHVTLLHLAKDSVKHPSSQFPLCTLVP